MRPLLHVESLLQWMLAGGLLLAMSSAVGAQTFNINCGGPGLTTSDGTTWTGDTYFAGGDQLYTSFGINNVSIQDLPLYRSGRYGLYGDFSYQIPVPNGSYSVTLSFAEILYSAPGQRVFNVVINGSTILSNFDILAHVAPLTPLREQFTTTVSTGVVEVDFQGVVSKGLINAIQVAPAGPISPSLALGTNALTFSGIAGGANPATQTVGVSNSGGGTLTWTASSNQSWLTVSPASGTNAGTLTVGANLTGLAAGTYSGAATVTAAGASSSPQNIGVTLTVSPGPTLTVGSSGLTFSGVAGGANPATQTVSVGNSGGGTLNWTASSNQGWLTVSPASGTNAGTLTLGANLSGLAAGTYSGAVTVSAAGAASSPQNIGVTLTVTPPTPVLSLGNSSLSFTGAVGGSNPATQMVSVSNTGTGTLNWTASSNQSWLTVSPASGTNAGTLTVGANLNGLAIGTYTGTVTVTSSGASGSPATIGVTLSVTSATAAIHINAGGGSMTTADGTQWAGDEYWTGGYVVYSGSSIANTNPQDYYLYRSARSALYGDFSYSIPVTNGTYAVTLRFAEITYSAPGQRVFNVAINGTTVLSNFDILAQTAPNTPLLETFTTTATNGVVQVDLTGVVGHGILNAIDVIPAAPPATPTLSVVTTPLTFAATAGGASPATQTVAVSNTGGGTLNWTASSNQTWLTVSPASGTDNGTLTVGAATGSLTAGTYNGTITVTGGGSTQTVPVAFAVTAGPTLSVVTTPLTFAGTAGGANPATQTVAVSNTGGGTLNWTASSNQTWLTVSPASGTNNGTLTVGAATGSLTAGTYNGTISVTGGGSIQTVPVTFAVTAGPTLSVVTTPLTFAATAGGANPATQTVAVSNTGGGTLNWTASSNQTWLTVSPASGTNNGTLTVGAATGSLTAGTYNGTITVTGGGSTQTVPVTFAVTAGPTLSVVTTPLTFAAIAGGANPATQTVAVSNTGGGTLNWTASSNQTWLTVSPASGSNSGTLTVGAVTGSLTAGTYNGTISVTGGGSTQTVAVTFNVTTGPTLSVVTTPLTFTALAGGANPATQTVAVSNIGGGTLNWTASGNQTWLSVSPTSGTNSGTLTVGAVTGSLAGGTYTGTVTVTGNGSTQTVSVTFNVTGPTLGVVTTPLAFAAVAGGVSPATQTAAISNTGGGTLNWTASSNQSWLTVSPASGTNTGTLTVGAVTGSLTAGSYSGTVTVSAAGATGSPQTIGVTFTVAPPPTLAVDNTAVWFAATSPGSNPAPQIVNVSNTGGGTINWTASSNQTWLTVTPGSGANAGALSLSASLGSLAVGTYTATVTVSAPGVAGSPQKIGVTFGITPPPVMSTSPASLSFTSVVNTTPAAQSINVTNTGGGTLNWSVTGDQNWLVVRPPSGSAPASISVQPNTTGLPVGTYSANVTVTATGVSGSPQTIPVSVTVTPAPPSLTVLTSSLSFTGVAGGASPAAQTVGIANSGGGTINWSATSNQPWLTVSPASGTTPGSISVQPVLTGLVAGNYSATVTVDGGAVTGSPGSFTVNLAVTANSGAPIPLPGNGNNWFVSTGGSSSADGSYGNPWDIVTALAGPGAVKPGDTIWLRGGKYGDGQYNSVLYSSLVGTAAKPIVVRAYPGERVTIDAWLQVGCCDQAVDPTQGSYVWFWGLEFASFNPNRTAGADGPPAWGFQYNHNAADTWAPGVKFINNVIHDTAAGISVWSATNGELNGNIVYNVGGYGPDRGHGHDFYLQNQAPSVVTVNDNIAFNNFDIGMQVYGNGTYGYVQNLQLSGNILFNSGVLYGHRSDNLVVGGGINGPSGIVVNNNFLFHTPEANDGYSELGYLWTPVAQDAVVTNNYFIGGNQAIDVERWNTLTFQNNTIYSLGGDETMFIYNDTQNPATYQYGTNRYFGSGLFMVVPNCDGWPCSNAQTYTFANWQALTGLDVGSTFTAGPPTGLWTTVRPNAYEAGRANIVVFNWNLSPSVTVDLTPSGIKIGDSYQIRDSENWYNGPLVSGVYTGAPVTIPMANLVVAQPFGSVPYPAVHTAPQFGVFVLLSGQSLTFNY